MVATLNIAGDSAGTKVVVQRVQHAHRHGRDATIVRNGSMMRVRRIVSSSLPGTLANSPAYKRDERTGEDDADDDEHDRDDEQRVQHVVAETPAAALPCSVELRA